MTTRTHDIQAGKVLDRSMKALGISMDMQTDPVIARSIIREMKLDDFKTTFPPMRKFFADVCARPQHLRPMFESIKHGIIHKHPAIVEFSELALVKKWFAPSKHIQRAVHVTYILEAMTAAMCNSQEFYREVENHVRTKERHCGIDSTRTIPTFLRAVRITHAFFKTIKGVSVDVCMIFFRLRCGLSNAQPDTEKLKMICKNDRLNLLEKKLMSPTGVHKLEHILRWIQINIYEAGITEYRKGYEDNALCAQILNEGIRNHPPATRFRKTHMEPWHTPGNFYKSLRTKGNNFPILYFGREWVNLYITWNMAFVLSDFDDLDIVMPSLFIPSIIDSDAEYFMGVRGISLWLTVNNYFFRAYEHSIKVPGPVNKSKMAQAWGKINKKYALAWAKSELHESPQTVMKGYNQFFSRPIFNFLKLVGDFVMH